MFDISPTQYIVFNEKDKFKNTVIYNKSYIERNTTGYLADTGTGNSGYETYYGYRDAINFLGEYNFNLDNRIVYGLDNEFDAAKYPDGANNKLYSDEAIYSQFLDYQFRPLEKLYATIGIRQDTHTTVSRSETTHRATIAYQLDNNSKIRASYGTGVRFPALYDYFYGDVILHKEDLKAEKGESFDIGYETYLDKLNLGLNISLFKLKQTDPIVGQARTSWKQMNASGTNESEGIEFSTNWKPEDVINIGFNYTFTDSFDSATCENPGKASYECFHEGTQVDQAKVRVPKHAFNASINYDASKNLKHSLLVKYSGERRDVGNVNNGYADVILKAYILFDIASSYNLWDSYKIDFSLRNIFDEGYEQAYEYSGMERAINFDIRKVF